MWMPCATFELLLYIGEKAAISLFTLCVLEQCRQLDKAFLVYSIHYMSLAHVSRAGYISSMHVEHFCRQLSASTYVNIGFNPIYYCLRQGQR